MNIRSNSEQAKQFVSTQSDRITDSVRSNVREIDFHSEDLLKLPTIITAAGLYFTYDAATGNLAEVKTIKQIRYARILDIADGSIARSLELESDAGAVADAVADKLGQLILAIESWKQNALPKKVISYLVVKNVAHTLLTIGASINHPGESFRTPKANKYAMLLENIGAGLLLEANAYEKEEPEKGTHQKRRTLGNAALILSMGFEASALITMTKRLNKDTPIA